MNSFLISIGAALVLALTAAFVGPQFVDWNGYRASIEAEGARVVRRPISIGGDVEVRLLPEPVLRAQDVRVLKGEGGDPLINAAAIDLSLDLAELLLGRVEITELSVVEPELRLEVLADGSFDLGGFADGVDESSTLAAILRRMTARSARLVFDDPVSGGERALDKIDLTLTSSAATGPYRISGAYGPARKTDAGTLDNRPTFTLSVGTLASERPVKISGRVEFAETGELSFDGSLSKVDGLPQFAGRTALERRIGSVESGDAGAGEGQTTLIAEAEAEIGLGEAEFDELTLGATNGTRALALTGSGRMIWDDVPEFAFDLTSRQVDLDDLLTGAGAAPLKRVLSDLAGEFETLVFEDQAEGRLSLTVDGAIWRGELVRDLALAVRADAESLTVSNFSAFLPGQSSMSLTGAIDVAEATGFTGELVLDTIEAGHLVAWASPEAGRWAEEMFASARGKLSLRAEVEADDEAFNLTSIEGFVNGNPFSGSLGFQIATETPLMRADLDFDFLDLDRYLPQDAAPGALLDAQWGGSDDGTVRPDMDLEVSAKRLLLFGREAFGARLSAGVTGDVIDLESAQIERFANSHVQAEGRVVGSDAGPRGTATVSVKTDDLARFLRAARVPTDWIGELPMPFRPGGSDVVLDLESGAREGGEGGSRATLTGLVSGVEIDMTATAEAPLTGLFASDLSISAELDAAEAVSLFGRSGMLPLLDVADGTGPIAVQADIGGSVEESLSLDLRMRGIGGNASANGTIDIDDRRSAGEAIISLADGKALASVLGLGPGTGDGPVNLEGTFDVSASAVSFKDIKGDIAGAKLSGSLSMERTGERAAVIDIQAEEASLPILAAALFAPDGVAGTSGAVPRAAAWGTKLIDTDLLGGPPIAFRGQVERLALAPGFEIEDATIEAERTKEGVSVKSLRGSADDGSVDLSGTVRAVDHALMLDGTAKVTDLEVGRYLRDGTQRVLLGARGSAELAFSARGRSMLSLVSSLEVNGSATVEDASLARFAGSEVFDLSESDASSDSVEAALMQSRDGATEMGTLEGPVTGASGRIRIGPLPVAAAPFQGEATTFVDVPSRRFDQEVVLFQSPEPDALHIAVMHAGAFDAIKREVEITSRPGGGAVRWIEPDDPETNDDGAALSSSGDGQAAPTGDESPAADVRTAAVPVEPTPSDDSADVSSSGRAPGEPAGEEDAPADSVQTAAVPAEPDVSTPANDVPPDWSVEDGTNTEPPAVLPPPTETASTTPAEEDDSPPLGLVGTQVIDLPMPDTELPGGAG